jgi:hypothetical protein
MTTFTWIKLYIEILDDDKLCELPDWLKWRMVQLFLVAREKNQEGLLGPVKRVAWRLRIKEDDLVDSLCTMSEIGVVAETPDGWKVVNFSKRQAPLSDAERQKQYRARDYNENVTKRDKKRHENVTEEEIDSSSPSSSKSLSCSDSGVRGMGEGVLPATPAEALECPEIQVFQAATGRIPGAPHYKTVIDTVNLLRRTRDLGDPELSNYLSRFWLAWSSRKRVDGRPYDPASMTWLTEWAVNNTIPEGRDNGKSSSDASAHNKRVIEELSRSHAR